MQLTTGHPVLLSKIKMTLSYSHMSTRWHQQPALACSTFIVFTLKVTVHQPREKTHTRYATVPIKLSF